MICNACGSAECRLVGRLEPYLDFSCEVFDCDGCGARFAPHDSAIHDRLHGASASPYATQHELGARVVDAYRSGDVGQLDALIRVGPTFGKVIELVEGLGAPGSLLEVGCSTGYLTAYFLAHGYRATGVDVSAAAIEQARRGFGHHFLRAGDPGIEERAPFDAIVHIGTVGCVADPRRFTTDLVGLLRPGGSLIFNAPNVRACRRPGVVWGSRTPPPDLVTLFDPGYWTAQFSTLGDVSVEELLLDPIDSIRQRVRSYRRTPDPAPGRALFDSAPDGRRPLPEPPLLLRAARRVVSRAPLPRMPAEFGTIVVIRRSIGRGSA